METRIGQCIYCGQSRTVEVAETATRDQINIEVTKICECQQAVFARESEEIQTLAEENVEKLFRGEFPDTASLLKAAVIPIMTGQMDSISIDTGKKIKGKVSKTKKGNVKVERTEARKTVLEG